MLGIYADAMLTATRHDKVCLREVLPANGPNRRRWFSHRRTICIAPDKL